MPARDLDGAALVQNWTAVVRAVDAVQHAFAIRLEESGMTLPFFSVLMLLKQAKEQRLPMSRIARDLAMTSGGFTKLADRMAKDGLIDRRGSSGDRRVVFAALTPAGVESARAAEVAYQDFLREHVLSVVSAARLETVAEILALLGAVAPDPDAASFELEPRPPEARDRRTDPDPDPEPKTGPEADPEPG